MLSELFIQNLAVIEKTNITFEPGLNTFTGETGAGKSIVIDAINAVLGQRISKDIVRTGEEKAIIDAVFTGVGQEVLDKLAEYGYEIEDNELLIRREISVDGKGTAKIGGRPVTTAILREIGALLINIHGQHDNQILLRPEKHIDILDSFGALEEKIEYYREAYRKLIQIHREVKEIDTDEAEKARKIDLLSYQIQEIEEAALALGEDERLENEKRAMLNYTEILEQMQSAYIALFGSEETQGAVDSVLSASAALSSAAELDNGIAEMSERIADLSYRLEDVAKEVSDALGKMEYDPRQLDVLEERLDEIYRLKRKYGGTIENILVFLADAKAELERIELSDEQLERLRVKEQQALEETRKRGRMLSELRKEAAVRLTQEIAEELRFLDMPNVTITAQFRDTKLRINGKDEVEFFISANPGEPPKPLSKIASGGELSRIMLAIKNALADRDEIPTLIFDEVDTGISGRAAQKVGMKLKSVAQHRQIICVTHLAQIAAQADTQFLIQKEFEKDKTYTNVHKLNFEGRKQEIARIIGTDKITETTLKSAEEMLRQGK